MFASKIFGAYFDVSNVLIGLKQSPTTYAWLSNYCYFSSQEVIEYPHTHDSSVDWWALGVLTYDSWDAESMCF